VTGKELDALIEGIAEPIAEMVEEKLAPLLKRIDELERQRVEDEKQMAALQERWPE